MRQWLRSHLTYANVMVTILGFIVLGGMSYAATGGNFVLGQSNSASSATSLTRTGANAGKGLQVTNNSTSAGATALGLNVASGHAPFTVNSGTKVANLNADKLDGKDSSQLPAVHFGAAPQHLSSEQVVIQWNDLGARFHTDGDTDFDNRIFLENTRSSGEIHVLGGTGTTGAIEPGGSLAFDLLSGTTTFIVWNATGTRSWLVACGAEEPTPLRCHGVASHATG